MNSKKIRNYNNSAAASKGGKSGKSDNTDIWNYQTDDPNSMFSKANMVSKYNTEHPKSGSGKSSGKRRKK